jgi:acetyl-CoA acetyltransferase
LAPRDPVIVGIGLSDYPKAPHLTAVQHHVQALQRALADSGVAKSAIDGYCTAGGMAAGDDPVTMAEYLGIKHRYIDGTMVGGSSFEFHVQHAAEAIRTGLCETVLITYGSDYLSRMGRTLGTGGMFRGSRTIPGPMQFEAPYGNSLVGSYALVARRHMHEFGTRSEQLAEIAVGVREYAGLNPHALYRDPITVDDVLASKLVADPLHKLDCCVISDGGCCIILTTEEKARDLAHRPVFVRGAARRAA